MSQREDSGGPPAGVMSRRQFLYVSGGTVASLSAAGLLAACGGGASPGSTAGPGGTAGTGCADVKPIEGDVGGAFNMLVWQGYEGVGLPVWDTWYADRGIEPNVKYITSDVIATFKSPAGADLDVSSLNQGEVPNGHEAGITVPLGVDQVPTVPKLYPLFQDSDFWKLCDGVYMAIPWQWGVNSIVTRLKEVPTGSIQSYEDLFDPKWKGMVGIWDDTLNVISMASVATGNDPGVLTREQLNGPVKEWLERLMPQLKTIATTLGDQANLLASGDVSIMLIGWAFFVPSLKDQGVEAEFVLPKEGAFGYVDSLFIPPTAPNPATSLAWINAMLEGETAKAVNDYTIGFSTNPEVNAVLDPAVLEAYGNPNIEDFLAQTKFNRSWSDPNGPYATIDEWNKVWNDVKAGTS